ncbi:MAG: hypothetical protein K2K63_17920, partial [Acetatifactor sp.]|nr:hypothetical protein [Acetatifactor sp.]
QTLTIIVCPASSLSGITVVFLNKFSMASFRSTAVSKLFASLCPLMESFRVALLFVCQGTIEASPH